MHSNMVSSLPGLYLLDASACPLPCGDQQKVGDAIQPSHPLSSPSPPAFNLSQHHSLRENGREEISKEIMKGKKYR